MNNQPDFDIIVYGATSFVGEIVARHIVTAYGAADSFRWAIAARNESRIKELKQRIGAEDVPYIIADASNVQEMDAMAKRARVVLSTVGPYALHGEPLIAACAENGTDYCDLSGETLWIRDMAIKYANKAKSTGARLVTSCGYDSIPSDMGVYFLQRTAKEKFGAYCTHVKGRATDFNGGLSGGTIASILNLFKDASNDRELRAELDNPYAVCPPDHVFSQKQNEVKYAEFDRDYQGWIGYFPMAIVNTRIVHRSNALLGNIYGADFRYDEAIFYGKGLKSQVLARSSSFGSRIFNTLALFGPTRIIVESLSPKSGSGPSIEKQQNGYFAFAHFGRTANNETIKVEVTGDQDPGYGSTSKMITEVAISLLNLPEDAPGGHWTTSALLGDALLDRLQNHAGLSFEVLEE